VIMVPNAAKAQIEGSSARVLRLAALMVGATSVVAAIPAVLAPHLIISVLFGSKYLSAVNGVLPMVVAGAGLAMTYLFVVYTVAIRDRRWIILLVCAVAVQIAGISLFHHSPTEIAEVQAAVAVFVLAGNEILFHPIISTRPALRRPRAAR
jgi:hypothetical protein